MTTVAWVKSKFVEGRALVSEHKPVINKIEATVKRLLTRVWNECMTDYLCKGWRAGARENETQWIRGA
jgi:hypothetical protein